MRTIIAGTRDIISYYQVVTAIRESGFEITEVISGTARGVDSLGERWAREKNIPCQQFPAQWDKYGKSAGYRRNEDMAKVADALIAVWDGQSRGTKHMINIARTRGLQVFIRFVNFKEVGNANLCSK